MVSRDICLSILSASMVGVKPRDHPFESDPLPSHHGSCSLQYKILISVHPRCLFEVMFLWVSLRSISELVVSCCGGQL